MNCRNFFASLVSAVVVWASVELGVLNEIPGAVKWDPIEYMNEWKWINQHHFSDDGGVG